MSEDQWPKFYVGTVDNTAMPPSTAPFTRERRAYLENPTDNRSAGEKWQNPQLPKPLTAQPAPALEVVKSHEIPFYLTLNYARFMCGLSEHWL